MRASGLSLATCALPIWICSVIASILVFAINESWGALCQQKAADIYYSTVKKHKNVGRFSFRNPLDRRDWSVEEIDDGGNATGPVVRQYNEDGRSQFMIVAQRAARTEQGWLFQNGFLQNYAKDGMTLQGNEVYFQQRMMPFGENLKELSELGQNCEMLNVVALCRALDNPFITSVRKRRLMKVLIWHRLTVPVASVIAALLAFSLTISTGRKGAVKGFAVAVALLVLFYLAGQMGVTLGRNGYLPPFVAGAMPQLLFLCGSAYLMYRRQ
jgi:lipopolysaccharide export system permease protein